MRKADHLVPLALHRPLTALQNRNVQPSPGFEIAVGRSLARQTESDTWEGDREAPILGTRSEDQKPCDRREARVGDWTNVSCRLDAGLAQVGIEQAGRYLDNARNGDNETF